MTQLKHYGVKGMKWGVRRSDEELAEANGEGAGGGGFEEDEESMLEELEERLGDFVDDMGEAALSSLKNVQKIGKGLLEKFKNATSSPMKLDLNKMKTPKAEYPLKNPEVAEEFDRYVSKNHKIESDYKAGKISKSERNKQKKENNSEKEQTLKEIDRKEKGLSKTTIYADTPTTVKGKNW